MTPERAARRLTDLLAAERAAAARGDLDRLAALAPEKERLGVRVEEGLASGALDAATAERLSEALAQSAPLLRAALEGVRAARGRMDARREASRTPFRTYGPDGIGGPDGARPRADAARLSAPRAVRDNPPDSVASPRGPVQEPLGRRAP